ncbi:MAG: polysaccharide deacetylase family protein [Thermodesulfobacteriota bacterium]
MRKRIKDTGLRVCLGLGRLFPPRGTPVLGYHSVADDDSNITISPKMFDVQMSWLKDAGYQGVSFKHFISFVDKEGRLPEKTAVLTFDDGLKDFYTSAWPVLRRCGFSATVFVPTHYIGGKANWYAHYGLDPVPMLDWKEIRELTASGIDIQSHGCSHRPLTDLAPDELHREVIASKKVLEEGLGQPIDFFCCPQGAQNDEVAAAIRDAGYKAGIGGGDGLFRLKDDRYRLKRQLLDYIAITDEKTARLSISACARGSFAWYVKAKKRVKHYG